MASKTITTMTFRIPTKLVQRIDRAADKERRKRTPQMIQMLEAALDEREGRERLEARHPGAVRS